MTVVARTVNTGFTYMIDLTAEKTQSVKPEYLTSKTSSAKSLQIPLDVPQGEYRYL